MMATPDELVGPVNIGNPSEFTMLELAEAVIALTGSRRQAGVPARCRSDDPTQRQPDITLARESAGLGAQGAAGGGPGARRSTTSADLIEQGWVAAER